MEVTGMLTGARLLAHVGFPATRAKTRSTSTIT